MDLAALRRRCLDLFHLRLVPGAAYGCVRAGAEAPPDFYASADWAIIRTIQGEDLRASLDPGARRAWCEHLAAQQSPVDGAFPRLGHHSDLHANGTAVGALGALGGRMRHRVRLYEPFATAERVGAWLESAIDWSRQWSASHRFWGGIHCFALSDEGTARWRDAVFAWLDAEADPATGWWRRGMAHADDDQALGGAVHILPLYQHLGRRHPYPERLIDSVLARQRPSGCWLAEDGLGYLDLDALYVLDLARAWAPRHRSEGIAEAAARHAALIERALPGALPRLEAGHPHQLLAAIGVLGLAQRFAPHRFVDGRAWSDIFSDPALYRVRACAAERRERATPGA